MAVSNLNVRVGFLFDEKGLKQIERQMRSAGQRLSNLGNQLTTTISLPLAAIGVAAIKSAGDFESLTLAMRTTFETAGRSIAEADREVQALRKSALAPGLDFEQAVKASIRLQAVELSAEDARKTIEQLANSIASTGGTAQNLESVTVQMAQMISKGKVLSQDLRIMQENMPVLSKLMKQAFGTSNAEQLQALGITGREFVEKITAEMAKLPRVSGGIANSIVNTLSALKNAAATLGLSLNKAFDITGKLDAFSAAVSFIADGFASLNPTLQATIGWVGALFFAIGPLTSAVGILKTNWATLVGVVGTLQKAVQGAIVAFRALALAEKATVIGAIVTVVLAAVVAFSDLSRQLSTTERAMELVSDAQADIASESAKEVDALRRNIAAISDQNISQGTRKKAIEALTSAYPEYLQGMNLEKADLAQLEALQNRVTASIIKRVAETKKIAATEKIVGQIIEKTLALDEARLKGPERAASAGTGGGSAITPQQAFEAGIAARQQEIRDLNDLLKKTEAQFDKAFGIGTQELVIQMPKPLKDAAEATKGLADATTDLTKSKKGEAAAHKENVTWVDAYLDSLNKAKAAQDKMRQAMDAMGIGRLDTLPQAGTGGVTSQAAPNAPALPNIATSITDAVTPAQAILESLSSGVMDFGEIFGEVSKLVFENGTLMQKTLFGVAESVMSFAESGGSSLSGFANAVLDGAKKVIGAYIRMTVAAVVSKALIKGAFSGNPFAAIAIAFAVGSAVQGLFNKLMSNIKIPEFAKGTKFAPGGLALVGERGPELVNLPRGSQVTPNAATNALLAQNAAEITLTHRISGSDLLFIVRRAAAQERRSHGLLGLRGI